MHLFDPKGIIKRYGSPEEILEEFFHLRFECYEKRKKLKVSELEREAFILENKVRFIHEVVRKEINVYNSERADLVLELHQKGFDPVPKKKSIESVVVGAIDDTEEQEERDEGTVNSNGVRDSDYDYLLYMPIGSFLSRTMLQKLLEDQNKINGDLENLRKTSPKDLWLSDLEALELELDKLDAEEANERKRSENGINGQSGFKVTKPVAPKQHRKSKAASGTMEKPSSSAMEIDDEVEALKDRLKVYKLDPSPGQSTEDMVTDVPEKPARKGPVKRAAVKTVLSDLSDNEDSDVEVVPKKGGRKPRAAGAKKRRKSRGKDKNYN